MRLVMCLTLLASIGSAVAAEAVNLFPPVRAFDGTRVISSAAPSSTYTASEDFAYLGSFAFDLHDTARVERHIWADHGDGAINRLIVIQFEQFLEGVEGTYSFSVPPVDQQSGGDYRFSGERVDFGDGTYVHNTWAFNIAANAASAPGAESDVMLQYLTDLGYTLADEVVMSRAVRVASDDGRAEVILFYLEPLSAFELELADLDPEGPLQDNMVRVSDAVTARHLNVMTIAPAAD